MGIFPFKQLMYRWQKLSQSFVYLEGGRDMQKHKEMQKGQKNLYSKSTRQPDISYTGFENFIFLKNGDISNN